MSSSNQCDIQALLAQLQQQQQQNSHVASNTLAPGFMGLSEKSSGFSSAKQHFCLKSKYNKCLTIELP
jgi:hypothetical protein